MCISPLTIKKNNQYYEVPCGKCIDCVHHRASDWRQRCLFEAKTSDKVYFATLTINDENMPLTCGLPTPSKRQIQLFHKRLRIYITRKSLDITFKYFLASEYGPQTKNKDKHVSKFKRPHYHALYFVNGSDSNFFCDCFHKAWKNGFLFITLCRSKEKSCSYIVKYISASGANPYFGNKLKFDKYYDFSEHCFQRNDDFVKSSDFNTFCLHSTSIGKKYFIEKIAPRIRLNFAKTIEFLREQKVNIVQIIQQNFIPVFSISRSEFIPSLSLL